MYSSILFSTSYIIHSTKSERIIRENLTRVEKEELQLIVIENDNTCLFKGIYLTNRIIEEEKMLKINKKINTLCVCACACVCVLKCGWRGY